MNRLIDMNADLGEGFPWDRSILEIVTSTSICCGAHAGSPDAIRATLEAAIERRVVLGAHPGYLDPEGFGRRPMSLNAECVRDLVVEQVETLRSWAKTLGGTIAYLKPHGALYNQAQFEPEIADGMVQASERLRLPLFGLPDGLLSSLAARRGLGYYAEGFPDRGYRSDGSLIPRGEPGATLREPDEVERNLASILRRPIDTLCIHGDDPHAVDLARLVRDRLEARRYVVGSSLA
ncbi:MAG: 5-oxoprolinase subunit PxpA [Isosphaeraceae bacterium]|nr:5-oxoprolinase subunit PxpA [Isosphaeraceae bacterium]